ncbi:hypothetical protein HJW69_02425 [Klebsiella pneumoniae]|nr:hypothetical protein HJW92_03435 [Klebsiella pneumoniae]QJK46583.1 hypothetical protein HJW92_24770 [Klebsiella pneumoniae]QJM51165.1 hypothetical protein HJW70_02600 [Klebsiella pneumoniae]QJM56309.1 hypothetical protein HJW69_02425 [Klebsiella pneumoniae]
MKLIGKDNGHMSDLKFLYSAVDELSNKDEITVTDFLALSAFVTSEKLDLESYQSGLEEGGQELSKDASAYLDLLQRMAADLSYPTSSLENAIHSAQSTASWAFYQWGLDKE